jgi:hypothetical protein
MIVPLLAMGIGIGTCTFTVGSHMIQVSQPPPGPAACPWLFVARVRGSTLLSTQARDLYGVQALARG